METKPLEGYLNPPSGIIHPQEGFLNPPSGIINPLGKISESLKWNYKPLGRISESLQWIYKPPRRISKGFPSPFSKNISLSNSKELEIKTLKRKISFQTKLGFQLGIWEGARMRSNLFSIYN